MDEPLYNPRENETPKQARTHLECELLALKNSLQRRIEEIDDALSNGYIREDRPSQTHDTVTQILTKLEDAIMFVKDDTELLMDAHKNSLTH